MAKEEFSRKKWFYVDANNDNAKDTVNEEALWIELKAEEAFLKLVSVFALLAR